ncbi:DUF1127 domain-containing protein [Psychromarinibacter sp. S121]|uniref:DUF1127 domain-containing protein n=1 Tax=Psychromarinibacter sp. S121 TaxID=3415127 RepID=UPI003C79FDCB
MQALLDWARDAIEKRRAIRELQGMTREGLQDLGIGRAQIRDCVHGRGAFAPRPMRQTAVIIPFPGNHTARRRAA